MVTLEVKTIGNMTALTELDLEKIIDNIGDFQGQLLEIFFIIYIRCIISPSCACACTYRIYNVKFND